VRRRNRQVSQTGWMPGTDSQRPGDTLHGCSGHPNLPIFSADTTQPHNQSLPSQSLRHVRCLPFKLDDKALDAVALTSVFTLDMAMEY
jgi:hypothetical protein